jgi:hypothetical protein
MGRTNETRIAEESLSSCCSRSPLEIVCDLGKQENNKNSCTENGANETVRDKHEKCGRKEGR